MPPASPVPPASLFALFSSRGVRPQRGQAVRAGAAPAGEAAGARAEWTIYAERHAALLRLAPRPHAPLLAFLRGLPALFQADDAYFSPLEEGVLPGLVLVLDASSFDKVAQTPSSVLAALKAVAAATPAYAVPYLIFQSADPVVTNIWATAIEYPGIAFVAPGASDDQLLQQATENVWWPRQAPLAYHDPRPDKPNDTYGRCPILWNGTPEWAYWADGDHSRLFVCATPGQWVSLDGAEVRFYGNADKPTVSASDVSEQELETLTATSYCDDWSTVLGVPMSEVATDELLLLSEPACSRTPVIRRKSTFSSCSSINTEEAHVQQIRGRAHNFRRVRTPSFSSSAAPDEPATDEPPVEGLDDSFARLSLVEHSSSCGHWRSFFKLRKGRRK